MLALPPEPYPPQPLPPGLCLPQNRSLVPKRLGTAELRREAPEESIPASTLILDFQPPEPQERNLLLNRPGLWYFVTAAQADEYTSQRNYLPSNPWLRVCFSGGRNLGHRHPGTEGRCSMKVYALRLDATGQSPRWSLRAVCRDAGSSPLGREGDKDPETRNKPKTSSLSPSHIRIWGWITAKRWSRVEKYTPGAGLG